MSTINCQQAQPWLDRAADAQLDGAPVGLAAHFNTCPHCTAELARIQSLKQSLRRAVDAQPVPIGLDTRIRARIQHPAPQWWSQPAWQAVAASLTLVALTATTWFAAYRPMRAQLAALLGTGQNDHVHCTLERKKPPFGELQRPLPAAHIEIVPAAQKAIPAGFTMAESHICRVNGRAFTHIVFSNGTQRLSVIVTAKRDGEALPAQFLFAKMKADGIPVYQSSIGGLQTAAIETPTSLGFVVSDLTEQQNTQLMAMLATTIYHTAR
ncbi:MAG: hypothetical protein U0R19_18270 [Bryobacteraceae bacterium]